MEDINLSINAGIDVFKSNITNVISNSQLPVGIVYYILKDILLEIKGLYNDTLQQEMQKLNKQLEDKKQNDDNKENSSKK